MPRFSPSGHDMALCQICGRDVDTGREEVVWRTDVTASQSAGNVCPDCMMVHDETKLVGEPLRQEVANMVARAFALILRDHSSPGSFYEHCRRESGLEGEALRRYIQRHYGHD